MSVRPFLYTVFLATVWAVRSVHALDFTLRPETQTIDGYAIHYFSFADGDQRIAYGPPGGWTCDGGGAQLTLQDPKNHQAQAIFTILPKVKPGAFTPEELKGFRLLALSLIPADSQNPTIADGLGRSSMGNREAYTVNLTYLFYGQKYSARATFLNLGRENLKIVCTAPSDKFDPFVAKLDSSLFSWHSVPAK